MDKDDRTAKNQWRAITEQGDLGLGAEVFNDPDQKTLNEAVQNNTYNSEENKK